MKKTLFIILIFFCSSTVSFADLVIAYAAKDGSKEPTPIQKVDIDKIKEISQNNNINTVFKSIPWKRALLLVEKGKIDGVINASYKPNRELYANYPKLNNLIDGSKRLNDGQSYYIYKHKDSSIKWDGIKFTTPDGEVAAMEKFAVIDDLKKHNNIKIKIFDDNPEIIRCLASKKIAAYAGTALRVDELLEKYPIFAKNIVRESIPIRKKDYFLIFSKKTYEQKSKDMKKIWNGLKKYNKL